MEDRKIKIENKEKGKSKNRKKTNEKTVVKETFLNIV